MHDEFNESELAVFCAADDAYVPMVLVALLSVREWHPDCGYYILADTKRISPETSRLVERFSIQLLDIGEIGPFVSQAQEWPVECFFILKGPELLHREGYRYSLSLDGDVYCRRRMNLASVLHQLGHWGGVRMFDRHPDPSMDLLVQELIDDPVLDRAFTNTGVLFWRNSALAAENWFEQCCDLYNQSASRGYRTPSDQHLLNLAVCRPDIEFSPVPEEYNFRVCKPRSQRLTLDQSLHRELRAGQRDRIALAHFVFCAKPWQSRAADFCRRRQPQLWLNSAAHFYIEWRALARDCLGRELAKQFFGAGLDGISPASAEVGGEPFSQWTRPVVSTLADLRRRLLLRRHLVRPPASAVKA